MAIEAWGGPPSSQLYWFTIRSSSSFMELRSIAGHPRHSTRGSHQRVRAQWMPGLRFDRRLTTESNVSFSTLHTRIQHSDSAASECTTRLPFFSTALYLLWPGLREPPWVTPAQPTPRLSQALTASSSPSAAPSTVFPNSTAPFTRAQPSHSSHCFSLSEVPCAVLLSLANCWMLNITASMCTWSTCIASAGVAAEVEAVGLHLDQELLCIRYSQQVIKLQHQGHSLIVAVGHRQHRDQRQAQELLWEQGGGGIVHGGRRQQLLAADVLVTLNVVVYLAGLEPAAEVDGLLRRVIGQNPPQVVHDGIGVVIGLEEPVRLVDVVLSWSRPSFVSKPTVGKSGSSTELMNTTTLQWRLQVALTWRAFVWRFLGPVMTQQRIRTFLYSSSAM
ncbi:hypothetical protein CRUP_014322 [Coryphaenoides rupestris]|nr:hypothetical protein CRUP_014322 [Coryphaenoides rupestris]